MKEMLLLFGVLIFWFVLNRYILPKMGVPT